MKLKRMKKERESMGRKRGCSKSRRFAGKCGEKIKGKVKERDKKMPCFLVSQFLSAWLARFGLNRGRERDIFLDNFFFLPLLTAPGRGNPAY